MINLNIQWVPVPDRSNIRQWRTNDINNQKLKTMTFFGTGAQREHPKAITPPSSDYTDAYLFAFGPKPIPTKHVHRLNTTVFANVPPIPLKPTGTHFSTNSSIRTSQTRFNNTDNNRPSNLFDRIVSPSRSSTYSSSFIPDISTKYEPFSRTQYSSPQTQSFNSNSTASFRTFSPNINNQQSRTTFRSDSPYDNIYKPIPPYSLQSYPPSTTYKPSVLFQSVPLPSSTDITQSSASKQTVLPSSDIEKAIDRPETLLFQHDEDIRSSYIEKPSPIISPLLESPITHEESKQIPSEELSTTSSKPIEIFEKTLSKYDSLINQISDVLDSVSPLSSTLSSMSPGKSVLDYELSSDSSPALQHKRIESQPVQQSTVIVKNTTIQRTKGKHLIRGDSYDKIITAIADLDIELTPPPDIRTTTSVIEEGNEEVKTSLFDDRQAPSLLQEEKEETTIAVERNSSVMKEEEKISLAEEQQVTPIPEIEEDKTTTLLHNETQVSSITEEPQISSSEISQLVKTNLQEEKLVDVQSTAKTTSDNAESVQQQTSLLPSVPSDEAIADETNVSHTEIASDKKEGRHVWWNETVVDNEEEESSFSDISVTDSGEERPTTDETTSLIQEPIILSSQPEAQISAQVITDEQINSVTPVELQTESTNLDDQQTTSMDSTELQMTSVEHQISSSSDLDDETNQQTTVTKRQSKSPSPPETTSTFSDSVDQSTTSSDLNESRSRPNDQLTSSISSNDNQPVSIIHSSDKDTFTFDEQSTRTSHMVSNENVNRQVEGVDLTNTKLKEVSNVEDTVEISPQLIENTQNKDDAPVIESTTLSSSPTVASPVDTLTFTQSISNIDSTEKSLLTSLRESIESPVVPLIETMQSVVSDMLTITAAHPLNKESEVTNDSRDERTLAIAMGTDSEKVTGQSHTQTEENKPAIDGSEEAKIVLENLHDPIAGPTTTVSDLQSTILEVPLTSNLEQIEPVLDESLPIDDTKHTSALELTSSTDIEQTSSPLLDTTLETVPHTITERIEVIQNVTSADVTSTHIEEEEQIVASSQLDTPNDELIDNSVNASVSLIPDTIISIPTSESNEQISSDTDATVVEQTEKQEKVSFESSAAEITTLPTADQKTDEHSSIDDKTTENALSTSVTQHDEQTVIEDVIPSENINSSNTQETINIEPIEDKAMESIISTPITDHDEVVAITSAVPFEQIGASDEQKIIQSIITTEQKSGEITPIEMETSLDVPAHPITTANERIENLVFSSITEEAPSSAELISTTTTINQTNAENVSSTDTIQDQIPSSQENEQIFTSQKLKSHQDEINPILLPSEISDADITVQQIQDLVPHKTDTISTEEIVSTNPMVTELKTDELPSILPHKLLNDTTENDIVPLEHNSTEINQDVLSSDNGFTKPTSVMNAEDELENQLSIFKSPQNDDIMRQSITELESNSTSAKTEIENIPRKLYFDFRELSPTNTEADTFELIHVLRGHSIALPNSPLIQTTEQITPPPLPEKSSSSTTSSQVTSSDPYVSYAIHEMGDSSQVTSSDRYVSNAIHEMGDSSQERLPSLPVAADIPVYKNVLIEPIPIVNQSITKEDDLTEFDASENLTSNSDDMLLKKLYTSATNRHTNLDTINSSTDDDVDDEFEQHDLTNIYQIIDKLTQQNPSSSSNGEPYQQYDLATTPSSNDSSSSAKQQTDDIYLIPGYPGLWRPSADNDSKSLLIDYDADDERKTATKTRTITRLSNATKPQSLFQYHPGETKNDVQLQSETTDIFNRPLNDFSFDIPESDSFQTFPSSISKPPQQSELKNVINKSEELHQTSSDENIILICERERGISLPVTMKIDYDDMALRLSTSTPVDVPFYSTIQTNLSSPSTHSEPPLLTKTSSNSRASTQSLSSPEGDQQKLPSWLNTINTITTTTEGSDGPLTSRTTLLKTAKGPISISEYDPQGRYIIIENTSRSKNIDLSNWTIRQECDQENILIYTFPDNYLLKSNHSIKIFTYTNETEQRNGDLIASSLSSWHTGPNIITTLINPEGQDRATLTKKTIFS